jgi:hypothetical protein
MKGPAARRGVSKVFFRSGELWDKVSQATGDVEMTAPPFDDAVISLGQLWR